MFFLLFDLNWPTESLCCFVVVYNVTILAFGHGFLKAAFYALQGFFSFCNIINLFSPPLKIRLYFENNIKMSDGLSCFTEKRYMNRHTHIILSTIRYLAFNWNESFWKHYQWFFVRLMYMIGPVEIELFSLVGPQMTCPLTRLVSQWENSENIQIC